MSPSRIEDYLAGRLSDDEARAFEDYCVANPEFARQVELEQRLKAGLTQVARGSTEEFVRTSRPLRWRFAAAVAGILVAASTLVFVWQRYVPSPARAILAIVGPAGENQASPMRLALERGADKPSIPARLLRVEIAGLYEPGSYYTVALERVDEKKNIETVATVHGVQPRSPVSLEVMLDGAQLVPGGYSLRVRRQTSVDEPLDIEFQRD